MNGDDDFPMTQPAGDLIPPPRKPPTAVAAATPLPPPAPKGSRVVHVTRTRTVHLLPSLAGFVASLLDAADVVADSIAEQLGLRERKTEPPPASDAP